MDTNQRITRRSAAGLLLAGVALPAAKALAAPVGDEITFILLPAPALTVFTTFSGDVFTAAFESALQIGSRGSARGYLRFGFGDLNVDYVAERGGLDLDDAGDPIRAWFLMSLRGTNGRQAQDYLLGSVDTDATQPCRIYDIVGTQVNFEPVRFEVDQQFEILRK